MLSEIDPDLKLNYKAVLFDFDGTLCDSWVLVKKAYSEALHHFTPGCDLQHIDDIRSCNNYHLSHQLLFKQTEVDKSYYDFTSKTYQENLEKEVTPLFPGVESVLDLLKRNNIPWGIVTTKRRRFVEIIISQHPSLQDFSVLLCAEDVKKGKPSPEGLLKACDELNILPGEAVYIGDLPADIQAASACNMDSIWVNYGYHNGEIDNAPAGLICISALSELNALLSRN